jgi:hypothetical protein
VFFAATIPFIAVLIVGLVGISRVNESISAIPAQLIKSHAFSQADCGTHHPSFVLQAWVCSP